MNKRKNDLPAIEELRYVQLEHIRVNPRQPRRYFAQADLEELAESIKAVGLIHPPVVRTTENRNEYELVSGERRFHASKLAGLLEIPVVVRTSSRAISAHAALIENIQRVDLNPMEIAKALRSLMEEFQLNQDQLAQRVGKKRSTIANYLRLLALPKSIQDSLNEGRITMGHAKALLALESMEKQLEMHNAIFHHSLSVRETEKSVKKMSHLKSKKKPVDIPKPNLYLDELAVKLQYKLGTKVSIRGKGERGSLSIEYFTLDDLERLLNLFGVTETGLG